MKLYGTYIGTVTEVHAPTDSKNASRYQYEYAVNVTVEGYAQIPVNNCIQKDSDGIFDNYEHNILKPGASVIVIFPKGEPTFGVIMGAIRNFRGKMPTVPGSKQYWHKRYNKFELSIDDTFNFLAKSDSGPYATVRTNQVRLDDSVGENLTLDKDTQTTTLNTKTHVTNVVENSNTTIGGQMTVDVSKDGVIHVKGNVTMTVDGNVNVKCANLRADVSGTAEVKASLIKLNGSAGDVLTTETDPIIDSIYGEPTLGVSTVKSG